MRRAPDGTLQSVRGLRLAATGKPHRDPAQGMSGCRPEMRRPLSSAVAIS